MVKKALHTTEQMVIAGSTEMEKLSQNASSNHKRKHITIETGSNSSSDESDDDFEHQNLDNDGQDSSDTEKADQRSGNESESDDQEISEIIKNEGWADSVAKILGTNKPKNKKTLVLSRAKKHSEVVKKEPVPEFDVIVEGEKKPKVEDIKIEPKEEPSKKQRKPEKPTPRVKPNILEKDRERILAKIATRGVVQLFNAVKNQQNTFKRELDVTGLSEGKREKIMKKFDKRTFLDTLMGQSKSTVIDESKNVKGEIKEEGKEKPRWNVLRDDFMMGAKLKDWDKEVEDD